MKAVAALMLMTTVVFVATGFKKNDEKISGATGGKPSSFVDLGLPSGTLWAKWNVGASSPEEAGDYSLWGKIEDVTEYTMKGQTLKSNHDLATINWGKNWRTPTLTEWQELQKYCRKELISQNNVYCLRLTGPNGNSIILRADLFYWTATLMGPDPWGITSAYTAHLDYCPGNDRRSNIMLDDYCNARIKNYTPTDPEKTNWYYARIRPVLKYTKDEYMMMSIEKQLGE